MVERQTNNYCPVRRGGRVVTVLCAFPRDAGSMPAAAVAFSVDAKMLEAHVQ